MVKRRRRQPWRRQLIISQVKKERHLTSPIKDLCVVAKKAACGRLFFMSFHKNMFNRSNDFSLSGQYAPFFIKVSQGAPAGFFEAGEEVVRVGDGEAFVGIILL